MTTRSENPRILIVDDEADLREILVEQISTLKIDEGLVGSTLGSLQIDTAENGAVALKMATTNWYDAILSDINMPQMSGLEFLAELRASGFDTPLVFLTAFGDKGKAIEALRLGAMDFMDKPWKADELRRVMGQALGFGYRLRDLEDELERTIAGLGSIPEEKRKQLRLIHRSLLLMRFNRIDIHDSLKKKVS